jgi:tetratricopeptide (TPR) repeat protein
MLPLDHVELLALAAEAHLVGGDRARGEVLLERALDELDPERDPRRYSALLALLARTQWQLNRTLEGVETAQRALAMLPGPDGGRERAALLSWLARTRVLRGRFREAIAEGEKALAETVAVGDSRAQGEVLNTLGMARIVLGNVDEGVKDLREALAIAKENEDDDAVSNAYSNLADHLQLAGRTSEALETASEGLAATPRRATRSREWMTLTLSQVEFESGHWRSAREHLGPPPSHLAGTVLIFRQLRHAELALAEGDYDAAAGCLRELEESVIGSSQPQWIGGFGTLLAELLRRRHDLLGARAAVAQALDRLEVCTDDVMRIASVSAVGLSVEADLAQQARDLRAKAQERDALARARIHMQRLRAAAQEGGPVERAWRAVGAAELARARGRSDPKPWLAAAGEWDAIARPYQAAIARGRAVGGSRGGGARAGVGEGAGLAVAGRRADCPGRAGPARPGAGRGQRPPGGRRRRRRGGSLRSDRPGAPGAGAAGRGSDQPSDRRGAVHGREDGQRARLAHPGQARRAQPHAGGGRRASPAPQRVRPTRRMTGAQPPQRAERPQAAQAARR